MENNVKKVVDEFIGVNDETTIKNDSSKKIILDEREGLIERVDRIFITKDGKQLLREQY